MNCSAEDIHHYIEELKELLYQSELIKQEIVKHVAFSKLYDRIGAIREQLDFICQHIGTHKTSGYFKHQKLALKLIEKHLADVDLVMCDTRLEKLKKENEEWLEIEELRHKIILTHEITTAELDHLESEEAFEHTNDYVNSIYELYEKTLALSESLERHSKHDDTIHKRIHHLQHRLTHIRNHVDHDTAETTAEFLHQHVHVMQEVMSHLFELSHHANHLIHALYEETKEWHELADLHAKIEHTIHSYEQKAAQLNNLNTAQHFKMFNPKLHFEPTHILPY